ncbi:hypothetical protein ACF08N_25755 [Streptomyces sp. NPDC015127]|uniref:hypothetical protein n=1 Tax=Streptomyces sp. NPDC015127 TaxID=3364939 RepID=UPI0037012301
MSTWKSWHRPLLAFAASMAVVAVVSAVGLAVDDRVVAGAPAWFKPFKFSVSFVAYALSLAWMLSLLPRFRRAGWWGGTLVAVTSAIEMILITGQAARGRRSHFNNETPFDEAVFGAMAVTVVVLWAATLLIAALLFRARLADRASAWAMRCGAVLALTGAALGFVMAQPTPEQRIRAEQGTADVVGAHGVGVTDGGPSMPLTGWETTGGDLRVPHFVGLHALQGLPFVLFLLVVLAPRFTRLADERVRLRLVLVASATYAGVFALVTWQALRGQALIHPDGATLGAAAAILAAAVVGTWAALRTPPSAAARPGQHDSAHDGKELVA